MHILADAILPDLKKAFPEPFILQTYHNEAELKALLPAQEVLICRSTLKVNQQLLQNSALKIVATASSGSDHLDKKWLEKAHIEWMDARGCNAHSVADYVLITLAALSQLAIIPGKKAGIIGYGEVGKKVVQRLRALGFQIAIFDPPLAERDASFESCTLEEIASCNLICIHAELQDHLSYPSKNMIGKTFLNRLAPGTILLNAARGGIIQEEVLLDLSLPIHYCTDVYLHEPQVNPEIIRYATLCTPHIAGHSLEAKLNAVYMISARLHQKLGLSPPVADKTLPLEAIDLKGNWQMQVLKQYNPLEDTRLLKESAGNKATFLKLRSAHNSRHDLTYI